MKRILCAVLMTVALTTPALAAKLYLKDGGVIEAKRVWRSGNKVNVLANRDTMTTFELNEVNLKLTFPKQHKPHKAARKRIGAVRPAKTVATPAPAEATTAAPNAQKKSPEAPAPSNSNGGTIKQHKKNMQERLEE